MTSSTPSRFRLLVMIGALYLVQGLPVGLAFQAYPVLLRQGGASLDLIALVPLASLPWVLKIVWASLVENRWSRRWGRRRSWILPMQALLALSLAAMALLPFTAASAPVLLGLIAVASVVSATQDIATDGLAAERLRGSGLSQVNAFQVAGFMVGMLLGGPAAMVGVGQVGHAATFLALALLVALCGLPVTLWREPPPPQEVQGQERPASLRAFFRRAHALPLLAMGVCATMGGAVAFGLARLILVDAGWSAEAVGFLSGTGHSVMILVGCGLASLCQRLVGSWTTLVLGALAVAGGALGWAGVAESGAAVGPGVVWTMAAVSGLGIGLSTVASYTVLMRFSRHGAQPGTDFSIFQGSQTLGEILMSGGAVAVAARIGYAPALGVGVAVAVATIGLVLWTRRLPLPGLSPSTQEG